MLGVDGFVTVEFTIALLKHQLLIEFEHLGVDLPHYRLKLCQQLLQLAHILPENSHIRIILLLPTTPLYRVSSYLSICIAIYSEVYLREV